MEKDNKIADYFSNLIVMVNQMKTCDENVTGQQVI